MLRIKTWSQKPMHYQSIAEYRDDWHLLFDNARLYNRPDSQIYRDAELLQKVFDQTLFVLSTMHQVPGYDLLPGMSVHLS